jgi:ABC-type multidrug transport system ATPase subunit
MSLSPASLRLEGVSRRYGRKLVLDGVSHTFLPGLTLLTGPSGAGKSTLLRLCATAEKPDAGALFWDGRALPAARRALRRALGYAPQAVDLPAELTAREFGLHMAALKGLRQGEADAQFRALLDAVGLGADANGRISTYSGGMRRRLVFAQALLGAPRLLALDEPTAELDAESQARVGALIRQAARSAVVIMTTHLADSVVDDANRVLRVEAGRLAPAERAAGASAVETVATEVPA